MQKPTTETEPKSLKILLVDRYDDAKKYLQALNKLNEKHGLAYQQGYHYSDAATELETNAFINGETSLKLQDLGVAKGYAQLRKSCYALKNCFIVFFGNAYDEATNQWLPELKAYQPTTPILLVRIKSPENDCSPTNPTPSEYAKAASFSFLECDLNSEEQVLQVLSTAIKLSLDKGAQSQFIADGNKIKNSLPKAANHTQDQLVAELSKVRNNTTFFRLLPHDITRYVVDLYSKDKDYSAWLARRAKEASIKPALADAGFIDPATLKNDEKKEERGICPLM